MTDNSYFTTCLVWFLAATFACILIASMLPADRVTSVNQLTVTDDTAAAVDCGTLIVMVEFAALEQSADLLEAVVLAGMLAGELTYFAPGDIVYPTGRIEYYYATDGRLQVIEIRDSDGGGLWWMFEAQTR